jgi:hypothetical protein
MGGQQQVNRRVLDAALCHRRRQIGIEGGAQVADQIGKRVGEILVLALAEAVAGHDDMAADLLSSE